VNRPIRRVGYAVTVLILLLVAQLTYLQVVDANNLANDPNNVRKQLKDYNRARGKILTADGQIVAESKPTTGDFEFLRVYPQVSLFAHVGGYQSFVNLVGSSGVEESYNKELTGQDASLRLENIGNALKGKPETNDVILSLTESAQRTAESALRGQRGSVVALDVQAGGPRLTNRAADVQRHQQQGERRTCSPALVPRPLLTGLDVQGRHEQVCDGTRTRVAR
jgi:penicillin-binding protein A